MRTQAHAGGSLRLLAPDLMHVTLCFLGSRPATEIEPIAAALGELPVEGVGELSLGAPVWLPRRRPRALVVELHDDQGGLQRLRDEVLVALRRACGFESERRGFRPHITVARASGRDRGAGGGGALPATPPLTFAPEALVLYRSQLAPEGARYEALATRALR
jgi:RNA 2',3'-cyclic 3'-phosphodiesterase